MANSIPRAEHPNPQFERESWLNLNGEWEFEIDNSVSGRERGLQNAEHLSSKIIVPFCPESRLSGVENTDFMTCVWCRRAIEISESDKLAEIQTILNEEHTLIMTREISVDDGIEEMNERVAELYE